MTENHEKLYTRRTIGEWHVIYAPNGKEQTRGTCWDLSSETLRKLNSRDRMNYLEQYPFREALAMIMETPGLKMKMSSWYKKYIVLGEREIELFVEEHYCGKWHPEPHHLLSTDWVIVPYKFIMTIGG